MPHSKVDPALRERRAVIELLHRVDKPDITYAELEAVAEELLATGNQVGSVLAQEISNTEDLDRLNKLTYLAAYVDDDRIVNALSRLLFHPHRTREYKAQILQALERLGVDTEHGLMRGLFRRQEMLRLNLSELKRRMNNRAEAAVQFLYDAFYASPEQRSDMARLLSADGDAVSFTLLGYLAELGDEVSWRPIVTALGRTKSEHSVRTLQEIVRYAVEPQLVLEAERALRRLRFSGHTVRPATWHFREDTSAWASRVEGNGTQMLWLAAYRGEGRADTVCFLVHEGRGVIDCFGEMHASWSGFIKSSVQEDLEDGGRSVPASYVLERVEHALAAGMQSGTPIPPELPFRIRCLQVRRLAPRLLAAPALVPLELDDVSDDAWREICDLFQEPVLDDWLISEPAFFQLVSGFYERERRGAAEVRRFVRRVYHEFVEPEMGLLQQRLLRNEEWMRVSGGEPEIADQLRLAAAVVQLQPADRNPFIQQYILKSVREAREMLREGYDPTLLSDDDF